MRTELSGTRQRSIRTLLALIFVVPLVSLLGLWGFAASVTASNAIQEHSFNSENQVYGGSAEAVFTQLTQERVLVYEWLSSGGRTPGEDQLLAQQRATDTAANALTKGMYANKSHLPASAMPALRTFSDRYASLTRIGGVREEVDSRRITALTAFSDYNAVIDATFNVYGALVSVNNTPLYLQASAAIEAGRAVEMASREVTLVYGAILSGAQMSKAERTLFAQIVASRQLLMADALRQLNPSLGSGWRRAQASAAYRSFTVMENQIIGSIGRKGPVPIDMTAFAQSLPLFTRYYTAAEAQDRSGLSSLGTRVGDQLLEEVALAGGAGLVAVALSVFLMLRFGRRIGRELVSLQGAALDLAEDRLPRVVSRLSAGEEVDVAAEAGPMKSGRIAETAKVAEAFSSVQRTAVEAAVGQARLRRGVSQVFRNLAWRSQSLLHRQLTLLDAMERRQADPEMLDQLFQLDHLTTRMRRHAEGLIILSGGTAGRGWREPVPVMDVVRGAIAEVEDYKRVTVLSDTRDAIAGKAVADVIHLLAELIENATTFSPAPTEVTVRAEGVANGFVVEIEDRGIGIGPNELVAFNERLADPPEFDLDDSNQLGLFVVARLASKHRIMVTLRRSPYGGTAAVVLMPNSIVVAPDHELEPIDVFKIKTVSIGRSLIASVTASLPPEEERQPAVTSPDRGAEHVSAGGARRSAVDGTMSRSGGQETNGNGMPRSERAGGTAEGSPWFTRSVVTAGDAEGAADLRGQHQAPSAWDRNKHSSAWEVDAAATVWSRSAAEPVTPQATVPPALPRRRRQASLAPQLRNGNQAASEAQSDGEENLSPEDTRALVESLQSGLDRATTTATVADESWPAGRPVDSAIHRTGEGTEDL